MVNNMPPFRKNTSEDDTIDIKDLFYRIKRSWHWIALCGLLGLMIAYFVNGILRANYEISAKLYAPNENKGVSMDQLFGAAGLPSKNPINVQNYIGILSSFSITRQTLENLDWRVSWYEASLFGDVDLYKYAPFRIESFNPLLNLPGVEVRINPIDNNTCSISVDDEIKIGGSFKKIAFETRYTYGDSLRNEYFNFVMNKEPGVTINPDKEYILMFNDLNKLAMKYQARLTIELVDVEAEIIHLKLASQQPEREADFLNELCQVFIDFGLRAKNRTSENTVNFIDAQLSGIVDSLQSTERSFTNFRSRNRTVDLNQEASLVVERLGALDSEESQAQMQLEYFQNLRSYLGDANKMESVVAPSVVGITDPVLNSMVVKLSELYSQRSTLRFSVQEKNPSLLALENEIKYTQSTLEENLRNLISNAQLQLNNLRQRKNQMSSQLAQMPQTEQDLVNIKRKFDLNNELYTFLMQKRAEAAITKASNVPDATILDPASVETALPLGPNFMLNYIIGLFLGIGLPVFLIAVLFYFDNTVKTKEDIERLTGIPVIGTLSHNRKKSDLAVLNDPHSGVTESFRGLRTNLDYFGAQNRNKIIAVHSTVPGEGKTFTAVNLAISIANNNKKVLLVCADLRKPKVETLLKIPTGNSGIEQLPDQPKQG
jgi:tyrosine-protein kinase Etk/Wzc